MRQYSFRSKTQQNKGDNKNLFIWYPGYRDINDIETLEYWLVYYKK